MCYKKVIRRPILGGGKPRREIEKMKTKSMIFSATLLMLAAVAEVNAGMCPDGVDRPGCGGPPGAAPLPGPRPGMAPAAPGGAPVPRPQMGMPQPGMGMQQGGGMPPGMGGPPGNQPRCTWINGQQVCR